MDLMLRFDGILSTTGEFAGEINQIFRKELEIHMTESSYTPVHLFDIEANEVLPFDIMVYLPMNDKYIKLVKAGSQMSFTQLANLKKHQVGQVFIEKNQENEFYEYCADKLVDLTNPDSAISQTERTKIVRKYVKDLLSNFVGENEKDEDSPVPDLKAQTESVVSRYLVRKAGESHKKQIDIALGLSGESFSHTSKVSTIAGLLSMATGIGEPEDLAIAGLFHDISLLDFYLEDQPIDEFILNLNESDHKKYLNHPLDSLKVLEEKGIELNNQVLKIIEHHHERVDGNGFPQGVSGKDVLAEAQLLAISDKIEYYCRVFPGKPRYSLKQTIEKIVTSESFRPDIIEVVRNTLNGE